MLTDRQHKNIPPILSEMLPDVRCCILPQITQIAQKIICENLRNLRLKTQAGNYEISTCTIM